MESEMDDMTAVKKKMTLCITEQQDKLKGCDHELKKKERIIRDANRIIKNIRVDIHRVSEHYQNPAKLKEAVKVSVPINTYNQ